jgi:ATP-dependent RNA helicase RhlE
VLVATDIASRGIDVEGISHVVNFDFPMHADDYVHRIGRTGRADAVGDAISFVTPDDEASVRDLERLTKKPVARKRLEGFDYRESAPIVSTHMHHAAPSSRGTSSRAPQYRERRRA